MGLFARLRRRPRGAVLPIRVTFPDPVAEVATLRSMIGSLLDVRTTAQHQVDELRGRLGRPHATREPVAVPEARHNDVIGEAVALQDCYDRLYEQVDGLWFEKQWLAAELAVAHRVGPPLIAPRRAPTIRPAGTAGPA